MMRPKILLRTHYQADEPRIIIAVVTDCASVTESRDEDIVAESVVRWVKTADKNKKISRPGAVYAVGTARALGLLNRSNRWTAAGLAFGYLRYTALAADSKTGWALGFAEERLFLRHYVANAGALLIKFGQWLVHRGHTTDDELRDGSVIKELLVEALDEYLEIATEVRDRAAIRADRDRLRRSEYAAVTKRHKWYPLRAVMTRLRLLDRPNHDAAAILPDSFGRLQALVRAIPNVATLETLDRAGSLPATLALALKEPDGSVALNDRAGMGALIASGYRYVTELGLQTCPLAFLDDLLYANFAFEPEGVDQNPLAEGLLEPLRQRFPGEVRFHVDRRGRRAFVLVTGRAWNELESLSTSS